MKPLSEEELIKAADEAFGCSANAWDEANTNAKEVFNNITKHLYERAAEKGIENLVQSVLVKPNDGVLISVAEYNRLIEQDNWVKELLDKMRQIYGNTLHSQIAQTGDNTIHQQTRTI